ncbi:hypothetical protein [Helicobacter sp. MIT 05-5294]|uniref:hypothetical protein n=1 Tax=Helicobacter sp. MIT 05-5294 TaxID=1548150 RepID=UPI00051FAF6F|nr:hypothetical protein [Helicobacter sp. MIT 05-5294]TLD89118.1 hypothetical protein LS69_000325 [Helicobacter sp. MIT 05-5294]
MFLSQNFLSRSSNFVASTTQNYTSSNAFQSDSNPQSDFDMLLALNQNPTQKDAESLIALNEITPDLSLVLGVESQTPTEDLKSLAWTHKTEFLKPISQATLSQDELNPLSYPHSISALSEPMSEKLEELYATIQDPSDSKLHFLLNLKEQFVHFDSTMQTLKGDLTNKAELLACLLPHTIEQKVICF